MLAVIQPTPIRLDEHDIALTHAARVKLWTRRAIRLVTFLLFPFIVAQAFAFGSFIYEEALQAASFGVRGAILCEDANLARDAVERFEALMHRAQRYQRRWGRLAFWSHEAFTGYFEEAAPTQLAGFYADGKRLKMWGENPGRYQPVVVEGGVATQDVWHGNAVQLLQLTGFNPENSNLDRKTPRFP